MTPSRMRELRITGVLQAYEQGKPLLFKTHGCWASLLSRAPTDMPDDCEIRIKPAEPRSWWLEIYPNGGSAVFGTRPDAGGGACEILQVFEKLPE